MQANKLMVKKRRRKTTPNNAPPTHDRIVQKSIHLFNCNGLRDVSIERIAKSLRISPGNITYHFPRKQQLVFAALEVMKEDLRKALQQPVSVRTPQDGVDYNVRLYRTLWSYRFFFNALTYVLTDPQLHREYTAFREWALTTIERNFGVLAEHGHFLPVVPPNTFRLLGENMWSLWLNWLRYQQVFSPLAKTPDDDALLDCAMHVWSLCQLWMRPEYARDLLNAYKKQNFERIEESLD